MITTKTKKKYYQALLNKNTEYEGVFYVGVKTTGVFCRPSCPARKPKFEHCEFFETAKEALIASFRPCKRCRPLSHPNHVSTLIQTLVQAIENNPEKRSSSGFRDAFSKIMGAAPTLLQNKILKAQWLDTPLGAMIAIADEESLYLLEFVERRGLEREIERLRQKIKAAIIPGVTFPIDSIERELNAYFSGKLKQFKTPIILLGSPFQKIVWEALKKIPSGETRAYADIASEIGKPSAYRAVANANGANQLAIVIPCHRIINTNGELGGYGGGVMRKRWLINHERASTN